MHKTSLDLVAPSLGSLIMIACGSESGLSTRGQTAVGKRTRFRRVWCAENGRAGVRATVEPGWGGDSRGWRCRAPGRDPASPAGADRGRQSIVGSGTGAVADRPLCSNVSSTDGDHNDLSLARAHGLFFLDYCRSGRLAVNQ
jgi:hypothetical protein